MKIGDSFYTFSNLIPNEENPSMNFPFFPFHNTNNNKIKFLLKEILGVNENEEKKYNNNSITNEKMNKILAFKENIFVHNKNLSLSTNNNKKKKKYFLGNKNDKNSQYNYIRPKSAIIHFKTNVKNSSMKSKFILDKNIFDISCIKNSKTKNNNFSYSKPKKKTKKNKNSLNYKKSKSKSLNLSHNFFEDVDIIKSEIKNKIMNLKYKKNKRPQIFVKRPIPTLNEKYLLFLPKEIKKDTKNKYNFFSYIKTDDMYHNNINIFNWKNKFRNKEKSNENKNKNNTIKNNLFNNYILKTKIEKISKLKKYSYKRNSKNTIYKPVKVKIDEIFNKYKNKQQNNEIAKGFSLNDEEGDFFLKIKSHPFKIKK